MKECNHCHQIKPLDNFHRNRWNKDGYQSYCKDCQKAQNMGKNNSQRLTKTYCLECGTQTYGYNKFCSRNCRLQYNWNSVKDYIDRTGKVAEVIGAGDWTIRKYAKRYLLEKYGHKCSICKLTTWNNQPIPLTCDHIDGDATNLNISDFRLICPNCDALLDTYKARNKGKGRQSRGLHF